MRAEIISVGTEILLGDIVNTNAQYLAEQLAALGIEVYYQSVVGDNPTRLLEAYAEAFTRSDLVITTGGLGPTQDDITKEIAAKYYNKKLVLDEHTLNKIKSFFEKRGLQISENNIKQAYMPENSLILENNNGTAPGCIINENNKITIMLPGPPHEMKPMFMEKVKPYIREFTDHTLYSEVVRMVGIGEGHMEEKIKDIMLEQTNPTIAPYCKQGEVTLRITAKSKNEEEAKEIIKPVKEKIYKRLGEYIYGENDCSIEEAIGKLLIEKNMTISTAESCTGGLLSGRLINYPGISQVFKEGIVTYSNEAKMKHLGVKEDTLKQFGAVSKETAQEMAKGIANNAKTDIGVSVTGIAGPGGVTKEKPVGLVYLGLYIKGKLIYKKCNFNGNRQKVRERAVIEALNLIRKNVDRC